MKGNKMNNKSEHKGLIDWIQFTLFTQDLNEVFSFIEIDKCEWDEMPKGDFGYKRQLQHEHISILYDGMDNMGIHIVMTGQGCSKYKIKFGEEALTELIDKVLKSDAQFTRIDIALDDFNNSFTIKKIMNKVLKAEVVSKFIKLRELNEYIIRTGDCSGQTIYFGEKNCPLQIRFYDKALKEKVDYPWIRTEIQCRDDRAQNLASEILYDKSLGVVAAGILKEYIRFVEPSNDSNRSRWKPSKFWSKYLGDVRQIRLTNDYKHRQMKFIGSSQKRIERNKGSSGSFNKLS